MKINTTKLRGLGVKVSLVPGLISWILALALGSSAVVAQATQEILNVRERNVDASRNIKVHEQGTQAFQQVLSAGGFAGDPETCGDITPPAGKVLIIDSFSV
jgi:hypothetical protein